MKVAIQGLWRIHRQPPKHLREPLRCHPPRRMQSAARPKHRAQRSYPALDTKSWEKNGGVQRFSRFAWLLEGLDGADSSWLSTHQLMSYSEHEPTPWNRGCIGTHVFNRVDSWKNPRTSHWSVDPSPVPVMFTQKLLVSHGYLSRIDTRKS
jgi:hypothetical protein